MRNSQAKLLVAKISYELQTSHIGSSLAMVDVISDIYATKDAKDHFVLDGGHAFLGYCAVREVLGTGNALQMYQHHGTHPDRCEECGIEVSSGSLGLAASVGLGMALAEPDKHTFVATTDGSLAEGIWWEVLNYANEKGLRNFHVFVSANGYGGYRKIKALKVNKIWPFIDIRIYQSNMNDYPPFTGLDAHYEKIDEEGYKQLTHAIQTA